MCSRGKKWLEDHNGRVSRSESKSIARYRRDAREAASKSAGVGMDLRLWKLAHRRTYEAFASEIERRIRDGKTPSDGELRAIMRALGRQTTDGGIARREVDRIAILIGNGIIFDTLKRVRKERNQ